MGIDIISVKVKKKTIFIYMTKNTEFEWSNVRKFQKHK